MPRGEEVRISHGSNPLDISCPGKFSTASCNDPIADLQPRANPASSEPPFLSISQFSLYTSHNCLLLSGINLVVPGQLATLHSS